MNYYLGIEGSGSQTNLLLFNQVEQVVAEGKAGPTSLSAVDFNQSKKNLKIGFDSILAQAGSDIEQIELAILGLEGIADDEQEAEVAQQLQVIMTEFNVLEFAVIDSAILALVNGTDRDNALVLKSGSQMAYYGENSSGQDMIIEREDFQLSPKELWSIAYGIINNLSLTNEKFDIILDGGPVAQIAVIKFFQQQIQDLELSAEIILPHQPAVYGSLKLALS